ncbi:hypothetical protein VQL36_18475 [Chengkuizengella sp. SCS-71B]|uniref:hypothetical protein n=1 Tax=Chengkuizengella sp. SCS-71B TaxID=3115290 RepID=UPI0032C21826
MMDEKKIEELIDKSITKYISEFSKQIDSLLTIDLRNENGNSKINKSGNSFVYVDNSAIAYAIVLLLQQSLINKTEKDNNIETMIGYFDKITDYNRETLEHFIHSFEER